MSKNTAEIERMSPEKGPFQKERIIFQPSFLRGELCNIRVNGTNHLLKVAPHITEQTSGLEFLNQFGAFGQSMLDILNDGGRLFWGTCQDQPVNITYNVSLEIM